MSALLAHVQTWRPYTLWYVGLLGLAGAGLSTGPWSGWQLAAAWATPTVGWVGAHYLGDYFDRELDALSKPHRPIPSGRLRPATALACGVAAILGMLAATALTGGWTGLIGLLAVAGMLGYACRLKADGLGGNLARGLLGGLAVLYGAVLVAPPGWPTLAFVLAFWLHDASTNLVGTLRDIEGDRAGGFRTFAVRRGSEAGARVALALYASALACAAAGMTLAGAGPPAWTALAGVAAVGAAAFAPLVRRRAAITPEVALRAHELLVLERVALAGVVVGLGLGALTAFALVVPALGITWWLQRRMRRRYEFGHAIAGERTNDA